MALHLLDVQDLIRTRRSLRRELLAHDGLQPIRMAVLDGSPTHEVVDLFELHLLEAGFYQSEYGQYYEQAIHVLLNWPNSTTACCPCRPVFPSFQIYI